MKNDTPKGFLALVLHAHLPFVRHGEHEQRLEERWFYEAMLETYLPLLEMFDRLTRDGIRFRLTMTLSPTLLSMLEDRLLLRKFERHFQQLTCLVHKELRRLSGQPEWLGPAEMYAERFERLRKLYDACGGGLIRRFRELQDDGRLEILTSAATHSFLPLLKNPEALRAQIATAVMDYERHFGRAPRGIWLPECGYTPDAEEILREWGLCFTFVDAHGLKLAWPPSPRGLFAPVSTPAGTAVFARDPESSHQVWSAQEGYPGDCDYREYYRDIGYDLGWNDAEEWEYLRPYLLPDGTRVNTGLKYFRITGRTGDKAPYVPEWAEAAVRRHAAHFVESRQRQLARAAARGIEAPIVVSPYDAELFGHWWFEGPRWLEEVFRKLHHLAGVAPAPGLAQVEAVTPVEYLGAHPAEHEARLPVCSWGRGGYAEVWLQPRNDWIYRHLHYAEDRMIRAANRYADSSAAPAGSPERRLLDQAARQLLLAQSSDWAFILDSGTVPGYAEERLKGHLECFHRLLDQLREPDRTDAGWLAALEEAWPCFPSLDYGVYRSVQAGQAPNGARAYVPPLPELALPESPASPDGQTILMLAWEYPPRVIGGLARAVHDLSVHLASQGHAVHVITCHAEGSPAYEVADGVHVHRVKLLQSLTQVPFYDWMFQMNLAFADYVPDLIARGVKADVLHAHDWLVYHSAAGLKAATGLPLVSTIHATEYGRNQGRIEGETQRRIHELEHRLSHDSHRLIACSRSMVREITGIFGISEEKLELIPNGVDLSRIRRNLQEAADLAGLPADAGGPILFFIGRLVREKGVQVLLDAMPAILREFPRTRLIVAGKGPYMEELERMARPLGDRVVFTGFLNDAQKSRIYRAAAVSVFPSLYEPFGIVALEAMSLGCPVVVSDTGGLAEIIEHGVDGCKAVPGDPDDLARQILRLLEEPELGHRLAEQALRKVEKQYNWEHIAQVTAGIYRNLPRDRDALTV